MEKNKKLIFHTVLQWFWVLYPPHQSMEKSTPLTKNAICQIVLQWSRSPRPACVGLVRCLVRSLCGHFTPDGWKVEFLMTPPALAARHMQLVRSALAMETRISRPLSANMLYFIFFAIIYVAQLPPWKHKKK